MRAMSYLARRVAAVTAALAAALALCPADAAARSKKPYWMVSFVGGALVPVGDTASERDVGLGVGLRVGYTTRIGLGVTLEAEYSPLPVAGSAGQTGADSGAAADVVTDNHFAAAALVPRFTLGRDLLRLTLGAGGGGIMEQTRSHPAGDSGATRADTVFAPAAIGELGIELHFWGSGGVVVSGSYLRSFGDRESEIGAVLGGLIFTFR
jgi:hypothetical protein